MNYSGLEWFAGVALGRMLFSLLEGTLLALLVSLAIRFLPGKSSQTRFILWLTALLASAALPFLLYTGWSQGVPGGVAKHEAVLISAGLAICIFLGWSTLALVGLVRVAIGVAGLRRLRKASSELDPELLPESLRADVELLREKRKVTLLVSSSLSVPTAIGFLRPAVVLPQWLVEEAGEAELKHLLLHELAHLRRWDDWTNLAQKVIKALLFFHPAIWWMERKLSLDREMACDDAVLASTGTPRIYAELLARMAEKSFLRRQIALAQAAVGHLTQLSRRVRRILDPQRQLANRPWKPAAPLTIMLALATGAGLSWVPELVKVGGDQVVAVNSADQPASKVGIQAQNQKSSIATPGLYHTAKLEQPSRAQRKPALPRERGSAKPVQSPPSTPPVYLAAKQSDVPVRQNDFVLLVERQRTFVATPAGWQLSVIETRWLIPAKAAHPQPPNKT